MRTIECSCRLWPTPGMYAVTSMWFVSRTRATLRSAEFGFLGVEVKTRTHTPRFCGDPWSAGLSVFERSLLRPTRTSWLTVGTLPPSENRNARNGLPMVKARDSSHRTTFRVYRKRAGCQEGRKGGHGGSPTEPSTP